jgi:hypothetical protein
MRQNVFGRPRCLCVSSRSGNTKRGSKRVGGCRDICEIMLSRARRGEVTRAENCCPGFVPLNAFGPCMRLCMSSRSEKIETGLKCCQWLPKKLQNTVLIQACTDTRTQCFALSHSSPVSIFLHMTEPAEAGVKIYKKKAEQNRIELSANTDQEWGRQTKSRYGLIAR